MRPKKLSAKSICAALLLTGCVSTASAQSYWYNGDYGLKQRGYYGTPYGGGPEYGSGGGDQYEYGPPTVTRNKRRSRYRRPAFGDGCGTGIIGFAPASEHDRCTAIVPHWIKVKNPKAPAVKREAEED